MRIFPINLALSMGRNSVPIESTFATVGFRTHRTKGRGSRFATVTMGLQTVPASHTILMSAPVNSTSWYALDSTLALGVTGGSGRFRRLSANHCFAGKPNISRRRLLRLFIRVAMAGRLLLSQLHERSSLEIIAGTLALFWMSQASFRSGWDGFPRHTSADGNLVSSDVVYH